MSSKRLNRVLTSGFEPEQTEPKSVMLPLHHMSIIPEPRTRLERATL